MDEELLNEGDCDEGCGHASLVRGVRVTILAWVEDASHKIR